MPHIHCMFFKGIQYSSEWFLASPLLKSTTAFTWWRWKNSDGGWVRLGYKNINHLLCISNLQIIRSIFTPLLLNHTNVSELLNVAYCIMNQVSDILSGMVLLQMLTDSQNVGKIQFVCVRIFYFTLKHSYANDIFWVGVWPRRRQNSVLNLE